MLLFAILVDNANGSYFSQSAKYLQRQNNGTFSGLNY